MSAKKYLEKLDYKGIAVLTVIALVLAVFYSLVSGMNIFLCIISMIIAVFGSFIIFASFFEEEKPVKLGEGETMILRTLDRGYLMHPKKLGGFMSKKTERDLNIYLTNKRILARKSSGEYVFDQPLTAIEKVNPEKRIMSRYLRVRYLDQGREKDTLLFVGDTDLWMKRLAGVGITDRDEFEEEAGEAKDGFVEDAKSLQEKVSKRK